MREAGCGAGLPTGNTPIALYGELQRRVDTGELDVSRVVGFAIDEFAGVPRSTPGTNSVFYRAHLRLPLRALHIPNPDAREPEVHIAAFADALRRAGGFDLCVLGIGRNGHIAFNEPGSERTSRARVVALTHISREAHAAAFGGLERVPERGLTLGVAELMESRAILVLATGPAKAAIVHAALEEPVGATCRRPGSGARTVHVAARRSGRERAASRRGVTPRDRLHASVQRRVVVVPARSTGARLRRSSARTLPLTIASASRMSTRPAIRP